MGGAPSPARVLHAERVPLRDVRAQGAATCTTSSCRRGGGHKHHVAHGYRPTGTTSAGVCTRRVHDRNTMAAATCARDAHTGPTIIATMCARQERAACATCAWWQVEGIGTSTVERLDQRLIRSTTIISTPSPVCTRKPTKISRTESPRRDGQNKFRRWRRAAGECRRRAATAREEGRGEEFAE
ncbi:hypothetical protein F511_39247 [Dorcoceras hygrometricum]|uniref:Uncharacterized protein n=1 Tax=Dorcoceras hygrometricum TaxID=472368 RepID=A0A2Z7B636_9LAMI|nr:hypothetical protein F511_39247 [Dorcoceras hygrometricum]